MMEYSFNSDRNGFQGSYFINGRHGIVSGTYKNSSEIGLSLEHSIDQGMLSLNIDALKNWARLMYSLELTKIKKR